MCFILITGFGLYYQYKNHILLEKEYRSNLNEIAQSEATAIERRVYNAFSATNILALEVRQNKGNFFYFDYYAKEIITSIDGISNLQLAPQGIISKIYPLQGNEKAIGHNILLDDNRKQEAQLAIKKKALTLAGPFKLIQGGIGIIGRNPVFLRDEYRNKDVFWGFVSVMIKMDDLLSATKLSEFDNQNHAYILSRVHPDTNELEIIAQSSNQMAEIIHSKNINLPSATWILSISSVSPHTPDISNYFISILLGLFISWAISYLFLKPEYLKKAIKEKTEELEKMAFHDQLTSLGNRRLLTKEIHDLLEKTDKKPAALLYLDLDDFKRINDSLGHNSGDYLLKKVAKRLTNAVKKHDIVTRLGGDEFALLLFGDCSPTNIKPIAKRIINVVRRPVLFGDHSLTVSASLGIAMIPRDGSTEEELLRNVDIAMYEAKNCGKNNYRFFNKELQLAALEKHKIELALNNIVKRDELFLHFQPQIHLKEKKVTEYEALLRWHHPEKGPLSPDKFIHIAESTGQIIPIGYWVFEQACKSIKEYQQENDSSFSIAVNLSSKQFLDPFLLETLKSIVQREDIDPKLIKVEVTESSIAVDIKSAIKVLNGLRSIGIKIAIDDFGTGFSSLSQLKNLPVDCLKIDKSFIKNLSQDQSDQKIVKAIIAMSHTLQINVVAEGIETQQQLDWLSQNGCDVGQGYLFAHPAPLQNLL